MMALQQINPPFDGSAPCPMCNQSIRGASAYVHNMLNRWREGETLPEPKFWQKLDDLKMCASGAPGYANPATATVRLEAVRTSHPDVRAHLDAILAVVKEYAKHDRPLSALTAQPIADALAPLIAKLRETKAPVALLSEAHFDDSRHSAGTPNILREQKGYSPDRGGNYDWFVRQTDEGAGHLRHQVCGTELALHDYFVDRIKRDRNWFGHVWCPECQMNLPFAQFECRI